MQVKVCSKCKTEKEIELFNRDRSKASGYRSWCKVCDNINNKIQYEKDPQARRDSRKEYYYANREGEIQRRTEFRKKNVDMHRGHKYMQLYGITLEQYEDMRCAQNYKCAICGLDEVDNKNKKLFVDHCHDTQTVRGLLCHWCNAALGSFKDNTDVLEKAITYLKERNGKR
jgi:hypothetical protein